MIFSLNHFIEIIMYFETFQMNFGDMSHLQIDFVAI